jgi:hypothetical protein
MEAQRCFSGRFLAPPPAPTAGDHAEAMRLALDHVRCAVWIDYEPDGDVDGGLPTCDFLDELVHYARPANGALRLVPSFS